ncbi:MAG: hypothetical protein KDE48_18280 [Anaerolineales bacterium]|nr:hypothetical protein [Anaerolineales bacterium]
MKQKKTFFLPKLLIVCCLALLSANTTFAQDDPPPCVADVSSADGIFVALTGHDSNPGTAVSPKRTISAGLATANSASKTAVFIAEGNYTVGGTINLINGISLCGGYDAASWQLTNSPVTNISVAHTTAIQANNITQNTVLRHLKVSATQVINWGSSSYGLKANFCNNQLQLVDMTLEAGNGSHGQDGSSHSQAASGTDGSAGAAGCEYDQDFFCSETCSQPAGGSGGINSFCSQNTTGGNGGSPGLGQSASGSPGLPFGLGGNGTPPEMGNWNPTINYLGKDGADGMNGDDGMAGKMTASNFGSTDYLPPFVEAASTDGLNGQGGGGGGGGGGEVDFCSAYGGGGGGGGAGGCGGRAGNHGTSGHGSFAVYLVSCDATIRNSILTAGTGGNGGTGGAGALGGIGGSGGWGGDVALPNAGNPFGSTQADGSNGGRGGAGGNGGRGGHGAGGVGGPSIGIFIDENSHPGLSDNIINVGFAGIGGYSAGNPGPNGTTAAIYPIPVEPLQIARDGSDVLLSWVLQPGTYPNHEILHNTNPYFQPDDPDVAVVTPLEVDNWTHFGAAAFLASNCYALRGITSEGDKSPVSDTKCVFSFAIETGAVGTYGKWNLNRTISFANPQAAHYNPFDNLIYVGRRGLVTDGLYRIEADNSATLLAAGDNIAAVAVDYQTGDIFASEDFDGVVYRTELNSTGRTTWVSGFHSSDDDPVGIAFAHVLYRGTVIAPGDGLVVDRGSGGADEVWRFSPLVAQGETAVHTDDGTLVDSVDIAIGLNDIYLVDDKDAGDGVVYRLNAGGSLTEVPALITLPAPEGIAIDPLTGNLLIVDIVDQKIYELDPLTGTVNDMLPGFVFAFPTGSSWAGIDISPDGQQLIITDKGVDAIYVFSRIAN